MCHNSPKRKSSHEFPSGHPVFLTFNIELFIISPGRNYGSTSAFINFPLVEKLKFFHSQSFYIITIELVDYHPVVPVEKYQPSIPTQIKLFHHKFKIIQHYIYAQDSNKNTISRIDRYGSSYSHSFHTCVFIRLRDNKLP